MLFFFLKCKFAWRSPPGLAQNLPHPPGFWALPVCLASHCRITGTDVCVTDVSQMAWGTFSTSFHLHLKVIPLEVVRWCRCLLKCTICILRKEKVDFGKCSDLPGTSRWSGSHGLRLGPLVTLEWSWLDDESLGSSGLCQRLRSATVTVWGDGLC